MNRGWAKMSPLTEMKRRPFHQKGRYFWLSIFLGLVPFMLFRIAVFYGVTFPIGTQSPAGARWQLNPHSNATRLDIGLPNLRERSNIRDDEHDRTKEDKAFVRVIEEIGAREVQGLKPNGREDGELRSKQFGGDSDGLALHNRQVGLSAIGMAKTDGDSAELQKEENEGDVADERLAEEHKRRKEEEELERVLQAEEEENVKLKEEEMSKLKEEEEESRKEETQTRKEEEQRWMEEKVRRMEESERKSEQDGRKVQKQEEDLQRGLSGESESKNKDKQTSAIARREKVDSHQKDGVDRSAVEATGKDEEIKISKEESQQRSDSNVISQVTSDGVEEERSSGQEKASDETEPVDKTNGKEKEQHDGSQGTAQQEEKVFNILSPRDEELNKRLGHCNLYDGDWEYDGAGPLYTNDTCPYMQGDQNCLANGRPDRMYLNWRWKPRHCDLPRFDAKGFLQTVKGKTVGFIGDSLARNQMQSLLCMLYQVEQPTVQYDSDYTMKYRFKEHEVSVMTVWAPYLVKHTHTPLEGYDLDNVLFMDGLHVSWTGRLDEMDIVVLAIGQWFFKSALYTKNDGKEILGCYQCASLKNVTEIGFRDVFRESMRMALERILWEWNKIVVVTTFGVQHYEHGPWDSGWCRREKPITMEEAPGFGWLNEEMRGIVLDEFTKVLDTRKQGDNKVFFDFIDITKVNLLRADGHPGPYRRPFPYAHRDPSEWVQNDCLHWCMPGPVDTWNQILQKIVGRYL